jgi:hypothetical protein
MFPVALLTDAFRVPNSESPDADGQQQPRLIEAL